MIENVVNCVQYHQVMPPTHLTRTLQNGRVVCDGPGQLRCERHNICQLSRFAYIQIVLSLWNFFWGVYGIGDIVMKKFCRYGSFDEK